MEQTCEIHVCNAPILVALKGLYVGSWEVPIFRALKCPTISTFSPPYQVLTIRYVTLEKHL
ncbi:hypothetical protein LLG38_11415 [bacterium]|nr:hypothetical protein [bacterium]